MFIAQLQLTNLLVHLLSSTYLLSGGVTHPPGECYCNWGPTYVLFHSRACFVPGCSAVSPSSPNLVSEVPLPCHGVPILALSQKPCCVSAGVCMAMV